MFRRNRILCALLIVGVLSIILAALIFPSAASSQTDRTLIVWHGGLRRSSLVHSPRGARNRKNLPVVLVLHGGGGDSQSVIDTSLMNDKADEEKFIAVYPQGIGVTIRGRTHGAWNTGSCCSPAMDQHVDDVGFISRLIDTLHRRYRIDKRRVYITGISNGAQMTYRLACELSERIAAVAPVAGTRLSETCEPRRPVPLIHFHGTDDPCALYGGGKSGGCLASFLNALGIPIAAKYWDGRSVEDQIAEWAAFNMCSLDTVVTYQSGEATCRTHQRCSGDAEVTLCAIEHGGHSWPGGSYGLRACEEKPNGYVCTQWKSKTGSLSTDISATDAMWDFFRRHRLAES